MAAVLVLIFLVPLLVAAGLLLGAAVTSRLRGAPAERWKALAAWVSVGGSLTALALAVAGLLAVRSGDAVALKAVWFHVGQLEVPFSLRLDGLQAVMAVVVAAVASLVHLFSVGYMRGDRDVPLYFAELSLFTAAMLLLVLAADFFVLYVAWELVGASSYLLISYYFERPAAAAAGKKAFLTTRIGDLGLLVALFAIATHTGSLDYDSVFAWVREGGFPGAWAVAVPLLVFAGAAGKSAQFPLHVWLPDAMEGPTPVSALIHAATMVAAGVYLVARTFPLFEAAPASLEVVAFIGVFTALMAAVIAVTQADIKRVLAYSTVSQLGFMMAALGAGAPGAAMFHLFTHAWFKALLFLCAGSVIHATGRQLVGQLGGLARHMPVTAWSFAAGAAALAGLPPFSGFWSKEGVLAALAEHHPALLVMLLVASFLTAFYVTRVFLLVFFGAGPAETGSAAPGVAAVFVHDRDDSAHEASGAPHESGWAMGVPLVILAVASVGAGFLGTGYLGDPLHSFMHLEAVGEAAHGPTWLPFVAVALGVSGVLAAWLAYGHRGDRGAPGVDARLERTLGAAYGVAARGFMVDDFYERAFIRPFVWVAGFFWRGIDGRVIDGAVDGLARLVPGAGRVVRRAQSGEVRDYLAVMAVGLVVVVALALRGL